MDVILLFSNLFTMIQKISKECQEYSKQRGGFHVLGSRISDVISMEVESSEEEENVLVGMSEEVEESDMSKLLRCSWNCSMVEECLTSLGIADGQPSLARSLVGAAATQCLSCSTLFLPVVVLVLGARCCSGPEWAQVVSSAPKTLSST